MWMKRFTDAGRKAIEGDNLYAALCLALMIPDICGSLEDPGPGKSQKRYERWFTTWALPKFQSGDHTYLTASDCYQLRCSLIHSGSGEINQNKRDILDYFAFFDKSVGIHLLLSTGNRINGVEQPGYLQMRADLFSADMFKSADEWDLASMGDAKIRAEKDKLLVIHSSGTVLGGVRFGW
jgi:hypothetical protein